MTQSIKKINVTCQTDVYVAIQRYQSDALSVVLQQKIHTFALKYVIFHIFYHGKTVYGLKNPLYCICFTLYHPSITFKTKNDRVYDLVLQLQAPKDGEIGYCSPNFMLIKLFRACCEYSTICMTHILEFSPSPFMLIQLFGRCCDYSIICMTHIQLHA